MPTPPEWTAVIGAAGAVGAIFKSLIDRYMNRNVDAASADKLRAEAKKTAQETASSEVDVLRVVIAEVRQARDDDRLKAERVEAKNLARIDSLEQRLDVLEERERHMLTRAAVHEAWDQLSFQALIQQNPQHPPPPPLALRPGEHEHD